MNLCWLLQLATDKKGNKANSYLFLSKNEADEIFIWIFPKYEGGKKMVIKYGSCTACTYFDCAGEGSKI